MDQETARKQFQRTVWPVSKAFPGCRPNFWIDVCLLNGVVFSILQWTGSRVLGIQSSKVFRTVDGSAALASSMSFKHWSRRLRSTGPGAAGRCLNTGGGVLVCVGARVSVSTGVSVGVGAGVSTGVGTGVSESVGGGVITVVSACVSTGMSAVVSARTHSLNAHTNTSTHVQPHTRARAHSPSAYSHTHAAPVLELFSVE